jgi:hypothetical protein
MGTIRIGAIRHSTRRIGTARCASQTLHSHNSPQSMLCSSIIFFLALRRPYHARFVFVYPGLYVDNFTMGFFFGGVRLAA